MHKEYRQRLAKEYRYAATRMQQESQLAKRLFYFSVFYGEAQRVLNMEWDRDLVLIFTVTQQAYAQINTITIAPMLPATAIDMSIISDKLTNTASDLAAYFEKTEVETNEGELCQILGRFAELAYIVSGNGSYLYEKGLIKL